MPGIGAVDRRLPVEIARDTLQGRVHQMMAKGSSAPDVGHGDGVERGVGIAGPVDRLVDQPDAEQDAIQEAELEAVEERPDQAVADRRDGEGQDQKSRHARGPDAGLIDQQGDGDRQDDLGADGDDGEDQRVLEGDPEQRDPRAPTAAGAIERKLAAAELRQADPCTDRYPAKTTG